MSSRVKIPQIEIPGFRVKRPHKKSRLGCTRCKQRRIKCDETRPCCGRCRLRGQDCLYEDQPGRPPPSSNAESSSLLANVESPSSSSSRALTPPPNVPSPHAAGVPDTDLARHYLSHTVETLLVTSKAQSNFWSVIVPALAYTSSPVRHGMLALAAMCLHYETTCPTEHTSTFLRAAEIHGLQAIEGCRNQLRDLHTPGIDSVLSCSRILCILGFAWFRTHRRNGATIVDPQAWNWLQMLRGVVTVYSAIIESGQVFDQMIASDMEPELPPTNRAYDAGPGTTAASCSHPVFRLVQLSHQGGFTNLRIALHERRSTFTEEQAADLFSAIDILQQITERVCSGKVHSLFRAICTWPCKTSQGFVEMLRSGNALALTVYAYWLVLVLLAEDLWWVGDMGRVGIREVVYMCSKMHDEDSLDANVLLHWPRRVLDAVEGKFASN